MADYVDITEAYIVAGDFDSRKLYLKKATTSNPLAIASGVTWSCGEFESIDGSPAVAYRWSLGSRGSVTFEPLTGWTDIDGSPDRLEAPAPTPLQVTDCTI